MDRLFSDPQITQINTDYEKQLKEKEELAAKRHKNRKIKKRKEGLIAVPVK